MSFRTISALAVLGLCCALYAQPAKIPTLDEILERLEANLSHYDANVPSFFCQEHVLSSQVQSGFRDENTVTDSIFRLKRTTNPDDTVSLEESREIKIVGGKPATSEQMDGPALLSGAFEGGLAVVSRSQSACMNYSWQRINKNRPAEPYIVGFETVLTPRNTANCLLQEKSKGRVFIDPVSMQVTHVELTTPRHVIVPGNAYQSPVIGRRVLTVAYAPVALNGQTFWMPSTIVSSATSGSGTFHVTTWSFHATYRNYRKLEVTSHIVPGSDVYSH